MFVNVSSICPTPTLLNLMFTFNYDFEELYFFYFYKANSFTVPASVFNVCVLLFVSELRFTSCRRKTGPEVRILFKVKIFVLLLQPLD